METPFTEDPTSRRISHSAGLTTDPSVSGLISDAGLRFGNFSREAPSFSQAASSNPRTSKNRCQFGADTGSMVLGSSHLVPCKNQGWFDPAKAPWAGGLGFTEPVPDRTVSGNKGMFVGQWGAR